MDAADSLSLPVTPLARYRAELARLGWTADPVQEWWRRLDALHAGCSPGARRAAACSGAREATPVRGLYLWGDTGRGKTWLVDLFYKCLPFPEKTRRHFHRFMADVHEDLKVHRDAADPLARVADGLAARARVICFDEFFVSDIADAMILGTLFEKLFARGVTLVATSNVPPRELYRDGLQRARFLPAIEQLERHTDVVHVHGRNRLPAPVAGTRRDLPCAARRCRRRPASPRCSPLPRPRTPTTAAPAGARPRYHRALPRRRRGLVRFRQTSAAGRAARPTTSRSPAVSTPSWSPACRSSRRRDENEARRFIALVDEFYDRSVKLILSAAVPLEALYHGQRLAFEFKRTTAGCRKCARGITWRHPTAPECPASSRPTRRAIHRTREPMT
jgi:cell division protein ZapE